MKGSPVNRKHVFSKAIRRLLLAFSLMAIVGCDGDSSYDVVLAGAVKDQNENGIQNVEITYSWSDGGLRTVFTDENGSFTWGYDWWRLADQPPLRVTVTPVYDGYIFVPPQYDLDAERSHFDINFIAMKNN